MARLDLTGRAVLVTGAARGIGEAVAREAAARGVRLGLVGLEPERLQALATELGPQHCWAEADVTEQAALERAVANMADALGGLDVVVANAGVANHGTVATNSAEALARTIEVNLIGVVRTVKATLPHVVRARGHYLLVASAASFTAMPGLAAYCGSKAGVENFANAFRLEVAHQGVTVGTAHPIWIDTDLVRDAKDDLPIFREMLRRAPPPLGRQVGVASCARQFVDGIAARRRKVYVPRSIGAVAQARTLLSSGLAYRVMAREAAHSVPILEDQVRRLGRPFGAHSVAGAGPESTTEEQRTTETLPTAKTSAPQ